MALDEDGYECASLEEARRQAMTLLPEIARDAASRDGDRHTYTMLVTDEDHRPGLYGDPVAHRAVAAPLKLAHGSECVRA